jgi:hypothetical protein
MKYAEEGLSDAEDILQTSKYLPVLFETELNHDFCSYFSQKARYSDIQ